MSDTNRPAGDDEGVTLSPDAPIGEPANVPAGNDVPEEAPVPGEGGVIAPGPTPESR